MDNFLFLLLGAMDAYCTMVLMFKLFRFPIREYDKEFIIIAFLITFTSYFIRLVLQIPEIDPIVQTILFIVLCRYLMDIKIDSAVLIVIQGYLGFILIQIFFTYILTLIGFINPGDLSSATGIKIYIIQLTGQLATIFVAWLLYRFNLGFSFIIRPPHEVGGTMRMSRKQGLIIGTYIALNCLVCVSFYFWLNMHSPIFIVFPVIIITFASVYYLTRRKEYSDGN